MINVYSSDMCMVICTFTNLNTNACDQKKLMLMIVLSYFELLIINISFVSMTCISHCHTVYGYIYIYKSEYKCL